MPYVTLSTKDVEHLVLAARQAPPARGINAVWAAENQAKREQAIQNASNAHNAAIRKAHKLPHALYSHDSI